MLSSKVGIERLINLLTLLYTFMVLLPFYDNTFYSLSHNSPQQSRFVIGMSIQRELFLLISDRNPNYQKMLFYPIFLLLLYDYCDYFLETGIYIDNLWETLTYRVSRIEIISPEDINKILIEDGKDMITLITCHPYPYNYQRYAVFCERYNGATSDNKEELTENSVAEMSEVSETTVSKNDSSQNFIKFEETLYYIVPLLLLVLVFVLFVCPVIVKKSKRRKNDNP